MAGALDAGGGAEYNRSSELPSDLRNVPNSLFWLVAFAQSVGEESLVRRHVDDPAA